MLVSWKFLNRVTAAKSMSSNITAPLLDDAKELSKLTKQGLIARVLQLQDHIQNLDGYGANDESSHKRRLQPLRPFSFEKCGKRRIALKFAYLGADYDGFAQQVNSTKTIEHFALEALKRTRLIPENENCHYSKCGRTDKGVSALEQVISLDVRSNLVNVGTSYGPTLNQPETPSNHENTPHEEISEIGGSNSSLENSCVNEMQHLYVPKISKPDWSQKEKLEPLEGEVNYLNILNRNTPSDIVFYAWAPVPDNFYARFHCAYRRYKYFFPKCELDLDLMRKGASYLVGKNNYQNFCKIDRTKPQMFERAIEEATIEELNHGATLLTDDSTAKCCFTVKSQGFLYHQVRYMMSVLFSVGMKQEPPETVKDLLNLDVIPEKPQFNMASEYPLILFETGFPDVKWIYDKDSTEFSIKVCQKMWTDNFIKQSLVETLLEKLTDKNSVDLELEKSGIQNLTHLKKGKYIPIKERQKRKAVSPTSIRNQEKFQKSEKICET